MTEIKKTHNFKQNLNPQKGPRLASLDNKIVKSKKIDKDLSLKVLQNKMSGRLFVEFKSTDGKMLLQKSFQGTVEGESDSIDFQSSIKSIKDLRKYFGMEK